MNERDWPATAPPAEAIVRAFIPQISLSGVRHLPLADTVLDHFGARSAQRIRDAAATGWLPLHLQLQLVRAVRAVCGDAVARTFAQEYALGTLEKPILKALLEGGIRLLGATPDAMARWTPRMWSAMIHGAGELEVEDNLDGTLLRLRRCPPALLTDDALPFALAASCEAFFTLSGCEGRVRFEERDGVFSFVFTRTFTKRRQGQ